MIENLWPWKVSFYYSNPKRNFETSCETKQDAVEESLGRIDVVSYIENEITGEWAKREANSTELAWAKK